MRRGNFLSLGFVAVIVAACGGAEDTPLLDSGSGGDGSSGSDGGLVDTKPVDTGTNCEATCATIPQGFRPVRPIDAKGTCPSGWVSADGVTNPIAASDACSCACNITQNPDCTTGKIFRAFDDTTSPSCGTTATTLIANGTNCTQVGGSIFFTHLHYLADPPPPSGGTCQYDAQVDKAKLSGTPARLCAPPQACQGAICDGGAVCIAGDGDQACPASFPTKTLVGDAPTAACSACGACTPAATCTGTISFFSDTQCTMGKVDVVADAVCKSNAVSTSTGYSAFTWNGSVAKAACTGAASSTPTAALDKPVTVCCK
jgi:hypothetical protein